tara:strand:+ start:506 stop:1117 length:612 start_codon:yes stop_codon:yes gene_type:complete
MIVELTVDEKDDTGVDIISFVESPAIEVDFLFFNENKEKFQFKDEDKRIVVGCAMIPNEKIIRLDADGNEYFVFFSEETVRKCSELYFKRSKQNGTNIDHNDPVKEGVTVVESWIVEDPDNDKSKALGFKDVLKGSWFVSYKVDNDTLWDKVKAGEVLGFSVEGLFTQTVTQENSKMENELFEIIESCMTREEKIDAIKEKIK